MRLCTSSSWTCLWILSRSLSTSFQLLSFFFSPFPATEQKFHLGSFKSYNWICLQRPPCSFNDHFSTNVWGDTKKKKNQTSWGHRLLALLSQLLTQVVKLYFSLIYKTCFFVFALRWMITRRSKCTCLLRWWLVREGCMKKTLNLIISAVSYIVVVASHSRNVLRSVTDDDDEWIRSPWVIGVIWPAHLPIE